MTTPTTTTTRCTRTKLRNLHLSQKLLVWTILLTVGFGYLGALANLFATSAPADGKQTLQLDEFVSIYRNHGASGLFKEITSSMGMDDVVQRYHGSGAGVTKMESALKGIMAPILVDEFGEELAQSLTQEITEWSHLPPNLRKAAYEEGVPISMEDGSLQFDQLRLYFTEDGERKETDGEVELMPLKSTIADNCVYCHAVGSSDVRARKIPLETYDQVVTYCSEDRGIPVNQLALTTHVHLLGFSVLFAMTGLLFSLTDWPGFVRVIFTPWVLFFQIAEIACWWLAKTDVFYAKAIFWLGIVIGFGLMVQIFGTMLDLILRRPEVEGDVVKAEGN